MSINPELSLFSALVLIYWLVTELFTTLFRLTGLPVEKAQFQVISLLTGCGFTTKESELFLSTRRRRHLARITMLFGYVFRMTIISAFINVFLSAKLSDAEQSIADYLVPVMCAAAIFVFIRFPSIRAKGDTLLEKVAKRLIQRKEGGNSVMLLDYIGSESIACVTLNTVPERFQGVSLKESRFKTETGILVMLVERPGQKAEPADAGTVFCEGDKITVFGNYSAICKTFCARERFSDT